MLPAVNGIPVPVCSPLLLRMLAISSQACLELSVNNGTTTRENPELYASVVRQRRKFYRIGLIGNHHPGEFLTLGE
jgi:hypothetical protein